MKKISSKLSAAFALGWAALANPLWLLVVLATLCLSARARAGDQVPFKGYFQTSLKRGFKSEERRRFNSANLLLKHAACAGLFANLIQGF
jgi:hypothetical protein